MVGRRPKRGSGSGRRRPKEGPCSRGPSTGTHGSGDRLRGSRRGRLRLRARTRRDGRRFGASPPAGRRGRSQGGPWLTPPSVTAEAETVPGGPPGSKPRSARSERLRPPASRYSPDELQKKPRGRRRRPTMTANPAASASRPTSPLRRCPLRPDFSAAFPSPAPLPSTSRLLGGGCLRDPLRAPFAVAPGLFGLGTIMDELMHIPAQSVPRGRRGCHTCTLPCRESTPTRRPAREERGSRAGRPWARTAEDGTEASKPKWTNTRQTYDNQTVSFRQADGISETREPPRCTPWWMEAMAMKHEHWIGRTWSIISLT